MSLIQTTDQESMNHICMLCNKTFPSGRSLGGHMRSHVINSTEQHHHQKRQVKKHSSVNNGGFNSNGLVVLDKLCKQCGKGFQSWKALFGHMKCHSEKVSNNHTKHNLNHDSSHSDNENSLPSGAESGQIKKSRSRNKRMKRYIVSSTNVTTTTITTASSSISMNANNHANNHADNHASTSIVSEIEQDQESEIAMCLMMLSRDEGKWGNEIVSIESSDHCNSSAFVKLTKVPKVEPKKPAGNSSKTKSITETETGIDHNDEFEDSSKRKFECITCNKSFHSYQALGGHKASHKKKEILDESKAIDNIRLGNHDQRTDQRTKECIIASGCLKKKEVLGGHECAICLKVFSSGQALGGHKRSHMIAETKLNQQTSMNLIEKVNEPVRGLIDLNEIPDPDTMEEDTTTMMMMNSSSTAEYKPWQSWGNTANIESTTLLGLLPTR